MAQEEFFSVPNLTWFGLGIAAEVFFLGFGITPQGMNVAAQVASGMGMMDGFNVAAGATEVATSGFEQALPVTVGEGTLDFGIE